MTSRSVTKQKSGAVNVRELKEKAARYYVSLRRYSTAVAVMWAIFTCGFVVINVIVFIQPQWIGRFESSIGSTATPGYIGLYEKCQLRRNGLELNCQGRFNDWQSIGHEALRAATFFIGVSCLITWLCIASFILFLFLKAYIVFTICGVLQFISAIFMFLGCLIFPAGWSDEGVRAICGTESDEYVLANCSVGWAYILAMVGIFDALFLAILAFIQATRQVSWTDSGLSDKDGMPTDEDSISSRPSLYISPANGFAEADRFSNCSLSTRRSRRSDFAL